MTHRSSVNLFDLNNRVAVVTGGTGALGTAMALGLAQAGVRVGVLGRRLDAAERVVATIEVAGGTAVALPADVLQVDQLAAARDVLLEQWGHIDLLVNAAGGNVPAATVSETHSFLDVTADAWSGPLSATPLRVAPGVPAAPS